MPTEKQDKKSRIARGRLIGLLGLVVLAARVASSSNAVHANEREAPSGIRAPQATPPSAPRPRAVTTVQPTQHETTPQAAPNEDRLRDVVSEAGRRAVGLYLPAIYFQEHSVKTAISLLRRTRSTAAVIDMKDGSGRVTYPTNVEVLKESVVNYLGDPGEVVRELQDAGLYTIARVTCFSDPVVPTRRPDRAIKHIQRDEPWTSWGTGGTWLDPYNRDNHRMIVEVAKEVEAAGFDEIQLDYVRFPVDDGTAFARYPAEDGTPRPQLLSELLRAIDEATSIPIGVDVFGLSAYREGDPSGLGQDLVFWRHHVDVYTPMLYINSMRPWDVGIRQRSRWLVREGVKRLRERLGEGLVIRPYLQAFEAGAGIDGFNPRFIALQIRGAREGGADGFLFWHPGAGYSMFRRGIQGPARRLSPFPLRVPSAVATRDADSEESATAGNEVSGPAPI